MPITMDESKLFEVVSAHLLLSCRLKMFVAKFVLLLLNNSCFRKFSPKFNKKNGNLKANTSFISQPSCLL